MNDVAKQKLAEHEAITEDIFREFYQFEDSKEKPLKKVIRQKLSCSSDTILNLFPILKWLRTYDIKNYLLADIIAGMTVAVMHIPHGLAYAPLGGQEPVVGLYMAVFPAIMYVLMGTSRHISLGTFAVLCIMVGQTVAKHAREEYSDVDDLTTTTTAATTSILEEAKQHSAVEVGIAVCFIVGLWQTGLGLLKLGSLSVLLSNSLVSGFTTGAAVHVVTYQFKNLLGIELQSFSGPLRLFYIYIDLFQKLRYTNFVTLGISLSFLFVLFVFNEYIKPLIQKKCTKCSRIPVPIELLVIIAGILISYFLKLSENHKVKIVAHVPTGLPKPMLPPFELLPKLIVDGFVIAIVAISISLSLAAIFAKKSDYQISGNQELLAYGVGNMFGSFFQCLPVAASLSRSLVQHSVGGKTLLSNVFTVLLIVLILLFIGPLFEPVPYSVLSAIVVVSLKGLLMQVTDFPKICKQSSLDGLVWITTFASVIILDLDYGLGIGILASVFTMVIRAQKPEIIVLGLVPDTNVFLDVEHYKSAVQVPGILILQIIGGLHFGNCQKIQNSIVSRCKSNSGASAVILNMIAVSYVDPTAVSNLLTLYKDLKKENRNLYLTDCTLTVYKTLDHCDFFKQFPKTQIIASCFDAVQYVTERAELTETSA